MTRHFAAVVLWICLIGSAMPPQDQLRPPVPVQRSENAAQGERYAGTWRGRLLSHNRDSAANGQDTIVLHGDRLVTAITTTLDGTARLPRIPLLLHELRRGDRLRAARALAPAVEPQVGGVSRALNNLELLRARRDSAHRCRFAERAAVTALPHQRRPRRLHAVAHPVRDARRTHAGAFGHSYAHPRRRIRRAHASR